jgi:hypothetical protein
VELTQAGEDELTLRISGTDAATQRILFDAIDYLPIIRRGAAVFGPGAVATTLKEDVGGVSVPFAVLDSIVGLGPNNLVRIVRSRSLVAKAGPYYPFPSDETVVTVRVTEGTPAEPPLADAKVRIEKVNALPLLSTPVGGVQIRHTLSPPTPQSIIVGLDKDRESFSDARGTLVFYFHGSLAITALEVQVTHTGHVSVTQVLPVTAGARNTFTIKLLPN